MSDIYEALLGNDANTPASNADLVARLRKQQALGQLAQLSGIAGLQKMGPELQNDAQAQATGLYKTREMEKDRALQRELQASMASEREKDRMALGASNQANARLLLEDRLTAGQDKVTEANATKAAAALDKNQTAYAGAADGLDRLDATVQELKSHPGLNSITGVRGMVYNIPGTDAAGAAELLKTLKSQTTIQAMLGLKNASRTGSTGFGQLSEAEGEKLQNSLAPLGTAQSADDFRRAADKIHAYVVQAKARLKEGLDREAAGMALSASGPTTTTTRTQGFMGGSLPRSNPSLRQLQSTGGTAPSPAPGRKPLSDPSYNTGG